MKAGGVMAENPGPGGGVPIEAAGPFASSWPRRAP
jgi:hypothetical protein